MPKGKCMKPKFKECMDLKSMDVLQPALSSLTSSALVAAGKAGQACDGGQESGGGLDRAGREGLPEGSLEHRQGGVRTHAGEGVTAAEIESISWTKRRNARRGSRRRGAHAAGEEGYAHGNGENNTSEMLGWNGVQQSEPVPNR